MRAAELAVLMHGTRAGRLRRDRRGRLSLVYDERYASDPDAVALSLSLPFQDRPHGHERALCWISSLLPDRSDVLRRWAGAYGAPPDPFGLLSTPIGHDCAGAVQFCPPGQVDDLAARGAAWHPSQRAR